MKIDSGYGGIGHHGPCHGGHAMAKITHPVAGSPQSIGGFANGCVIGAQPLPLESADYQVMRSDQRRYFGHPDLLNFIHRLSAQTHQQQLGTVLIGDMAMPAGGRFSSGHASHQSGLMWIFGYNCQSSVGASSSY